MVIVQLSGGLGNQMFQYTFSKYIEKTFGKYCVLETNFFLNVEGADGYTTRAFELDKLSCHYILLNGDYKYSELVTENIFKHDAFAKDLTVYAGYWQNKKYFEEVRDIIRADLSLRSDYITSEMQLLIEKLKTENSISLHVRRGDYINKDNKNLFCELSKEYYEKALKLIKEKSKEPISVYVFSDDIDYVRAEYTFLNEYQCTFMATGKAYQDLYLMSQARNHVIANSSFSWWGAALTREDIGMTVAPSNWYKNASNPDLYPGHWEVI